MSQGIQLQADLSSSSVAFLSASKPLLKAISADDVQPLAVLETQAIGSCFHSNGKFASQVPDLLTRCPSHRVDLLSLAIGWQKNDTAWFMSQTVNGRTAALLCHVLHEICGKTSETAYILHLLAHKILPSDELNASQAQLGRVVIVLSRKIAAIGFGKLWSIEINRILRFFCEASSDSDKRVPTELMRRPTLEVMVDFLHAVSRALVEEDFVFIYNGQDGAGRFVVLLMALCPDDVWLTIDGITVFRGERKTIIFNIKADEGDETTFMVEKRVGDSFSRLFSHRAALKDDACHWFVRAPSFQYEGCLADCLVLTLAAYGCKALGEVPGACAKLLFMIIEEKNIFKSRLRALLGPYWRKHIERTLRAIFVLDRIEFDDADSISSARSYLRDCLLFLAPSSLRPCGECPDVDPWSEGAHSRAKGKCNLFKLWYDLADIIMAGLRLVFLQVGSNCPIQLRGLSYMSTTFFALLREETHLNMDVYMLHKLIIGNYDQTVIGQSDEGSSTFIYPKSLDLLKLHRSWSVNYYMVDGSLYKDRDRIQRIVAKEAKNRTREKKGVFPETVPLAPSPVGQHSSLTRTVTYNPDAL